MHRFRIFAIAICSMAALVGLQAASAWALNPPVNTLAPAIIGSTQFGQKIRTNNGGWKESPTSFTYQWRLCNSAGAECANIAGATGNEYLIPPADIGHTLVSQVTAHNAAGETTASSKAAAVLVPTGPYFLPSKGTYPVQFLIHQTGRVWIQWHSGSVECSSMSGNGTITAPTEIGSAHITLTGCQTTGFFCNTIESTTLHGHFGYVNKATKAVGLVLEEGEPPFAKFKCQASEVLLKGAVIGLLSPVNTKAESFSLAYEVSTNGIQSPNAFEGGPVQELEWRFGGEWEKWGFHAADSFLTNVAGEIVG
jgi:hypothetical protein